MSVSTINPRGFFLERQVKADPRADQKHKIVNLIKIVRSESVVGRDEGKANIILVSDYVSRTHCLIELDAAGKMFIKDMVSSNGTFVNDVKIKERTEVKENDMLGIGCDVKTMEKNLDNKLYFFYKVKVGHVFEPDEIIELPDSDEEDIDHLCEDLAKNSGIAVQEGLNNDVIELSDEEEESKFKEWEKKLSQGRSPPPANQPDDCQCDSSSAFPDPLPKQADTETGLASVAQDPLKEVKKEVHDSNNKTPDLSPESSPTKANDEVPVADLVPATPAKLLQQNHLETGTPGSSDFYYNSTSVKLRNFTVEIRLLSQNEIDKYHPGDSSDDDVLRCPPKPKNTARTKKLKKVLPSEKQKYVETAKIMKNLNAICDTESSEDDDEPKKKKVKNVSKAADSKTAVKKRINKKSTGSSLLKHLDDLEVVPTNNSLKIIMRRKSTAEIDVAQTSDFPLPVPIVIMRSVSRSVSPDPIAAPVTKPKLTVSQVARKINIPTKNPVPIIEPLAMKKRRQSTGAEATAPKRKLSTSESKDRSRMPKRRMTVCDPPIDMFAAAVQIRNGKRRMSVDQSSSDLKQDLHRERAEKLRQIADEKKQTKNKETATTKDRVVAKAKVKITNRNRGDFLTELPITPCAPPKKPSNGHEVSWQHPGPSGSSKIHASVVKAALPVPVSPSPSVLISNFRQEHVKPIFKTAAPTASILTSPDPTDASSDGICNNLDFYGHAVPNLLSTFEPQVMGFYNQMNFSQNTETSPTPVVASKRRDSSILKSPLSRRSAIKKKVSFPEDRLLAEVRMYEQDDHFCPLETPAHVEMMPVQDLATKEKVIERILMWNPKFLLEPEQNNNDNTIVYNELLIEIRKAFGNRYTNTAKNYWEHLDLNAFEEMPNGVARLTFLSTESNRGYRQDSLLLLKVYQPLKPVEPVKLGYITHTSTTSDFRTKIVVYTKFNKQDLWDVAVLKCRPLYYIQPEMDKLCALERQTFR